MEKIGSNLNSITPRGTRFARERLAELVAKVGGIQKRRCSSAAVRNTVSKLGLTKRLTV